MVENFFKWDLVIEYFPKLLEKLPVTLNMVAVASIGGVLLGVFIAFLRIERVPVLDKILAVFVSFIRGTPILIQMFIVYYGLIAAFSAMGINIITWKRIYFIYITYSINGGVFMSEVFRGAITGVPKKQLDAALSIGHTKAQAYLRIILPQSVIAAIPSLGVHLTNLLQDTAIAFMFGIVDVIGEITVLSATHAGHRMEGYLDAAIIFVVLTIVLERVFNMIEQKTAYKRAIIDR